jgi:hypothetical protein
MGENPRKTNHQDAYHDIHGNPKHRVHGPGPNDVGKGSRGASEDKNRDDPNDPLDPTARDEGNEPIEPPARHAD